MTFNPLTHLWECECGKKFFFTTYRDKHRFLECQLVGASRASEHGQQHACQAEDYIQLLDDERPGPRPSLNESFHPEFPEPKTPPSGVLRDMGMVRELG